MATAKKTLPKRTKAAAPSLAPTSQKGSPVLSLIDGTSEEIEPSKLILDPQNLRLLERVGDAFHDLDVKLFGQDAIQKKLYEVINSEPRFDVQSLAISIANNGFLKHERLIVARYDGDSFIVLEGNRRLTAVRRLFVDYGKDLKGLASDVRESLRTLPCFVLDGPVIDKSEDRLKEYRRAAEIYIGMRHLMGAKSWEPASRYEFQSRLIFEEGWSISDVAARFGRKKEEVIRDLKAHLLYQEFVGFEKSRSIEHSLTYNAFSEAARAPAISKWLGWSDKDMEFQNEERKDAFFHYLIAYLRPESSTSEEREFPEMSAEATVRRLRDILRLEDASIEEAILDRDFKSAEIIFEERKEGTLAKKIGQFARTLKRAPTEELISSPEVLEKLKELQKQVEKMLKVTEALSEK